MHRMDKQPFPLDEQNAINVQVSSHKAEPKLAHPGCQYRFHTIPNSDLLPVGSIAICPVGQNPYPNRERERGYPKSIKRTTEDIRSTTPRSAGNDSPPRVHFPKHIARLNIYFESLSQFDRLLLSRSLPEQERITRAVLCTSCFKIIPQLGIVQQFRYCSHLNLVLLWYSQYF